MIGAALCLLFMGPQDLKPTCDEEANGLWRSWRLIWVAKDSMS